MKLTIEITMDNDAFVGFPLAEVSRILCHLAGDMAKGGYSPTLRDINGNVVGNVALDE